MCRALPTAHGPCRLESTQRPIRKCRSAVLLARALIVLHRHDVAGLGFIIEMHLDSTGFEVTQHDLDPPLDRSMVCAVAGDEFLDNGPQRSGRKLCVGDAHGKQLSAIRFNFVRSIDRD